MPIITGLEKSTSDERLIKLRRKAENSGGKTNGEGCNNSLKWVKVTSNKKILFYISVHGRQDKSI